ncbi:MAG: hypothetical protein COW65_15825 [Cytophagales bacterium CG18_big_fil_WC_8_21_14_2_50_42_9]|nr:MAG: hypothetical protein COW65_15825 [Cytophagales bacterium CG18_big_fil_WC_8_21_14_2_50_42_9]
MKNLLFLIFLAASIFLAIFFYRRYTTTQIELELANRRIMDRDTEIYRLQKLVVPSKSLPLAPTEKVTSVPSSLGQLSAAEISRLQQKGLQEPEADLKANFATNQKTILATNENQNNNKVLRDILILNEHYALAYFEENQRGGYVVLRYNVQSADQIDWQVLDTYLL